MVNTSDSDDLDLPSSQDLDKAAEAGDNEKRDTESISSESAKDNYKKSTRKISHSGTLWEVKETEKELKYRAKNFKDPDEVLKHQKLRCTSCCTYLQSMILEGRDIYHHPVLKVLMCKNCIEFYGDGNLSLDEDGSGKYCRWCAQGGLLYCCSSCCNAFCKACIKRNLNRSILLDIESEEWQCFVCDGRPLWDLRAICKNAYIVSKKIKKKKKEEQERSLRQLQKKKEKKPNKTNPRRLNTWQRNVSRVSSSDEEDNDKKVTKIKNKRKRHSTSSSSDGGKPDKKKKQKDCDSDVALIEYEKECIVVGDSDVSDTKKTEMSEEEELPEEADPVDIKEVNGLLTEHLNDIIHFGELVAYRAKRLLQKKVSENDLANPKKVDKVIDSVNLLVKLAGENMQHTVEFLTSRHKHWVKKVKIKHKKAKSLSKHVSSKVDNVKKKKDDIPNTDIQDEKVHEDNKKISSGSDVQVNGIVNIESDEDDKPLIIHKKSVKETFATEDEEKSEDIILGTSVQNETLIITEKGALNEDNSDAKEVDALEKQDNGKEVSENIDSSSEFDENEALINLKSKTPVESTENSSQEIEENSEVQFEKNVSEVHAEKTKGIKKNAAIEFSEKDNSNDEIREDLNSVNVMETSNESDESISSKTTIKLRGLNESVEDIFADLDTSFQNKNTENIPHDDDKKQHIVEEKESKKEIDVSSNGTSTIELVCSQISDEDSVGTNAVVDKSHNNKTHLEKNCKEEDSMSDEAVIDDVNNDSEASDPLALDQPKTEGKSEKRKSVKAKKDNDNEIKIDSSNSENEDNDTDKSRLNDSHLEENSDGERPNENEDIGLAKKEEEEKDDNVDECIEAQEALLGYSSDEESGEEEEDYNEGEKHKKRRKKKGKMRKPKEIDEKKEDSDTKIKKKGHIGPKSKTQEFRSSSSSGTDINSDSSGDITLKRGESTKKKRLKLKDTEAYRNDKKLGWKCSVDVERLCEEEFQKYYSNYSDDVDEAAKNTRDDDKEIKRLVNLKSLRRRRNSDDSDSEDSDDSVKRKKQRKPKKDKKVEQEQTLIDFFNKEDEDGDDRVASDDVSDNSGSDNVKSKPMKKKVINKENDMAMRVLLAISSSDDEDDDKDEVESEVEKKRKKKSRQKDDDSKDNNQAEENENDKMDMEEEQKTEDEEGGKDDKANIKEVEEQMDVDAEKEEEDDKSSIKEEEEKMEIDTKKEESEEEKEIKEDSNKNKEEEDEKKELDEDNKDQKEEDDNSNDSDKSEKQNKKNWRSDKLLTEKLTDLDTSDEERLWNKRKQKQMEGEDSDSDMKSKLNKKLSKKKIRRQILGSDDDDDTFKVPSTSSESESQKSSSDSDVFVKKKKRKAKKSDSDVKSDSSSDFKTKKPKRRRIKAPASDSSSNEDEDGSSQKGTPGKGRKKIHHIMSDDNVAEATRKAAKEEEERRKRIAEKQKLYNEIYNEVQGIEKLDKLVLDFDPESKKELVSVDPTLVSKLKPHQAKGVKFMWDACFESLKHIKKTKGSGCILAHCMGLGKTFQIVSLVHTLLTHEETKVKTVLVICPLSTVLNWCSEFNKWLKDGEVTVFELTRYKQNYERQYQLKDWMDSGGVMVLGYEMYRNLTNPQAKRLRKKAIETFQTTLVDPGPDLIVCDEGHILKNEDSAIAKALRRIKTLRRIVLTGTPLQNNLKEYHCMVQFVKPNLLGTRKEFLNRFVNPISNGQFEDSTLHDVKIMKRRAHVLHKMLEGSVQRFDYSVLTPFLPPKHEYVISIRLHEMQIKAYSHYLEFYARNPGNSKGAQLFSDFNNLQRIWTHPRVLQMNEDRVEKIAEKKRLMESDSEGSLKDFIDDDGKTSDSSSESSAKSSDDSDVQIVDGENKKTESKPSRFTRNTRSKGPAEETTDVEIVEKQDKEAPPPWWKQFIQGDELENIKYSGKLVLLFSILKECEKIGDKVLVFSQSLLSLDLIEYFLSQIDASTQSGESKEELGSHTGSWSLGLDYFRLDGSASSENRNIWCKSFNREDNHRARLFLISTRAGGLGINLFAANRVIIFDASWNPSHDVQSIFRVYRFGQKKPCYIYRFLAQGTMEEKIYDRQVTKLSLSCRVVDEQQIERHYNMADLQELYQFDPEQKTKRPTPILPKDRLLAELLKEHEQWIVTYHEHDSLLENKEEEELNEEERKAAWEDYENEKKGKVFPNMPGPGLNMQALREALRKENPQATEEELEQKLTLMMGQIYEYLNSQQNAAAQQKYTSAQLQALQQYQIQQQQFKAQKEQQMRIQQDLSLRTAAKTVAGYNPTANLSFQQYLQNQNIVYKTPMMDKAGTFRMHSKLVPFNANAPGASRVTVKSFAAQDLGPNHLSRPPVILPQSSLYQAQPSHPTSKVYRSLNQGPPEGHERKNVIKKSVPDDVIETIE